MHSDKPFLIGITGGSASGKTLFLNKLFEHFKPEDMCLISQDNYYRPREQQPADEKGVLNFDTPNSIDFEQFSHDIALLHSGKTITRQEYVFNNPEKIPAMLVFEPRPIIIVEGIFVFYFPEISNQLDLKVFIDAQEHIKFKRRIIRDQLERGYGLDDVLYRYEHHVAPTFEKYIKPFMYEADIIIPNNRHFENGLQVLIGYIKSLGIIPAQHIQ